MSPYADIIMKATGTTGDDVILIENIMREEIFHSTLDWQTKRQLQAAARAAHARLLSDYQFHHQILEERRLSFAESKLESSLNQSQAGSPEAAALSLQLKTTRQKLRLVQSALNRTHAPA